MREDKTHHGEKKNKSGVLRAEHRTSYKDLGALFTSTCSTLPHH